MFQLASDRGRLVCQAGGHSLGFSLSERGQPLSDTPLNQMRASLGKLHRVIGLDTAGGRSDSLVGVEHDAHKSAHGVRREVLLELAPDTSGRAVGVDDLAPHASVARVRSLVLHLVDVGNTLAKVELRRGLIVNAFDLNQCLI